MGTSEGQKKTRELTQLTFTTDLNSNELFIKADLTLTDFKVFLYQIPSCNINSVHSQVDFFNYCDWWWKKQFDLKTYVILVSIFHK